MFYLPLYHSSLIVLKQNLQSFPLLHFFPNKNSPTLLRFKYEATKVFFKSIFLYFNINILTLQMLLLFEGNTYYASFSYIIFFSYILFLFLILDILNQFKFLGSFLVFKNLQMFSRVYCKILEVKSLLQNLPVFSLLYPILRKLMLHYASQILCWKKVTKILSRLIC